MKFLLSPELGLGTAAARQVAVAKFDAPDAAARAGESMTWERVLAANTWRVGGRTGSVAEMNGNVVHFERAVLDHNHDAPVSAVARADGDHVAVAGTVDPAFAEFVPVARDVARYSAG